MEGASSLSLVKHVITLEFMQSRQHPFFLNVLININPPYSDLTKRWFSHETGLGLSHNFKAASPGGWG